VLVGCSGHAGRRPSRKRVQETLKMKTKILTIAMAFTLLLCLVPTETAEARHGWRGRGCNGHHRQRHHGHRGHRGCHNCYGSYGYGGIGYGGHHNNLGGWNHHSGYTGYGYGRSGYGYGGHGGYGGGARPYFSL